MSEIEQLRADLTEARAEIAALRGLAEGAVGSGWEYRDGLWLWGGGVSPAPGDWGAEVYIDTGAVMWAATRKDGSRKLGINPNAPTLRAAMRAALDALGVSHE